MLDTDICVDIMRHRSPGARSRLERTASGEISISSIVAAELWTGAAKSGRPRQAASALREFLIFVQTLDWPAEAAEVYGQIRARLEASGQTIGAMDMLIAAHAIYTGATLISRHRAEYDRIADLKVETWNG